ncbi:MAG: hypothetical protein ACOYEV_05830 [Candidatus Nanopelagicales bacterium]
MSKSKIDKAKLEKAHEGWRAAEEKYAAALAPILASSNPTKIKRDDALRLAALRAKSDARMDEFFKRALA